MSLNIHLINPPCPHCGSSEGGWEGGITHNLTAMASAAGIYQAVWRPDELFDKPKARNLIPVIERGLKWLEENKEEAGRHGSPNGYGTYDDFLSFIWDYLDALHSNPDADVWTYR